MELQFLGTGAGVPSKQRNVTSIALKLLDERNEIWLFDCGEGTQQQILETTIKPRKIEKIFITHLHGDHIFGLPGLLSSRSFQGGETTLEVYGPKGIKNFIQTSLKVSESHLKYQLNVIEIEETGLILEDGGFKVYCEELDHRIKCYGYRVEEPNFQGELQVEKLKELNIPAGPVYKKIKDGEIVTLNDGRVIDGKDFIGESRKGRIVTILGDTRFHPNSQKLAKNADVLVHESTFSTDEGKMAKSYFHSTSTQAGTVAKEAGAKKLVLTHISARYLGKAVYELEKEAKSVFKNTRVVKDFDIVDIPLKKDEVD
ncbi:ribonuclease Z [Vagococcus fluvialis]|uniref:ribonuclease Z n=1 Tax=Vagococcus fluvialis TaxID=2738 RepID=UPI001432EC39|nr:ribonuclease Z [Vagococcus fluvialis]MBO0480066.1 ribonuclease Z [Vagococcus fluvialis]MBO0483150.1 ribonuclease Z [Vagococcus fluvialis]NKC58612.1 ribonuclease Z [Vagococcus fluvialis]NKD49156.1 ribonuclease Z [Vagococcus fluvialis]